MLCGGSCSYAAGLITDPVRNLLPLPVGWICGRLHKIAVDKQIELQRGQPITARPKTVKLVNPVSTGLLCPPPGLNPARDGSQPPIDCQVINKPFGQRNSL
nr:MAG TPA: hypothetical protein [Caudoviricetes sp.]